MGLLFERFYSTPPAPRWNAGLTIAPDVRQEDTVGEAAAKAFLGSRWAVAVAPPAPPLPSNISEQPAFDDLYAPTSSVAEDGAFFIEFDGFLIDRQTAASVCGSLPDPRNV